jgi:hypothetical protein
VRERPGDVSSVIAPGDAKPAAADPDDDQDEEDDSLVVPGFGRPPPPRAQGQHGATPPVVSCDARNAVRVLARTISCPDSAAGKVVVVVGGNEVRSVEGVGLSLALRVVRMACQ